MAAAVLAQLAASLGAEEIILPSPDGPLGAIRADLVARVDAGELPSAAVAVLHRGEVVWREALGWSDVELRSPASPATPYGLASVGKSITATAVMTLVEAGKLDLDAPVAPLLAPASLWSPGGYASEVTVRHLLDMTASIPHGNYHHLDAAEAAAITPERLVTDRGLVVFPPGEVYMYSNFSYAVLERVIERASGTAYEDYVREAVFAPLGMTASGVSGTTAPNGAATRYGADSSRLEPCHPRPRSSLGLHASLDDLVAYARFHLGEDPAGAEPPLTRHSRARMHDERSGLPHAVLALGWASIDLDGGRWLLTNGRSSGAQATVSLWPADRVAVVVLTNISGSATDDLAFSITDALVPGFLDRLGRLMREHEAWEYRPYVVDDALLGRWQGAVRSRDREMPLELLFQPDGDVHVRLGSQAPTLLDDLAWREGLLDGRFLGELPLDEEPGHPHAVQLTLRREGARLRGYALSIFETAGGWFNLPAYVELGRPAGGTDAGAPSSAYPVFR